MFVRVKWIKAPCRFGYAHKVGSSSLVEQAAAKKFEELGVVEILEVKKPRPKRAQTRPMKREKED